MSKSRKPRETKAQRAERMVKAACAKTPPCKKHESGVHSWSFAGSNEQIMQARCRHCAVGYDFDVKAGKMMA